VVERFLDQCEREALHLSGAIQPHGALVVARVDGGVTHVSDNIETFFGGSARQWLGAALPEPLNRCAKRIGAEAGARTRVETELEGPRGALDVVVSRGPDASVVVEMSYREGWAPEERVREAPEPLPDDESRLQAMREELVGRVAQCCGFERVMYYQFREDGDGEVIAEVHQPEAYGSYRGLRFPASDIPKIARELYLKNPWRLIPDAAAEPVPVVGIDSQPPDLTWSDLRSVSPVHRVYLANMGVAASLSLPVVINGGLSALLAAHHRSPRRLPLAMLDRLSVLVRNHALVETCYQSRRRMRLIDGLSYRASELKQCIQRHGELFSAWAEIGPRLMEEFHADGAMICNQEFCATTGLGLERDALDALDHWFCEQQRDLVWSGESLSRQIPAFPLSEVAGVMAIRAECRAAGRLRVYLTRAEHVHEVRWGGNPEKPAEFHDGTYGIAPRQSFEKWVEKRHGYSRAWDNESRLIALKLRAVLQE
jgi:chemotaxis family two-component system sensor kinase Cph1